MFNTHAHVVLTCIIIANVHLRIKYTGKHTHTHEHNIRIHNIYNTYTYIHTYIHAYIYTHIYMYTHIYSYIAML